MKKKKAKKDYSFLLNILILVVFLSVGLFIYISGGKKDTTTDVKKNERTYQTKQDNETKKPLISSKKESQNLNIENKELQPFKSYNYKYTYTIDIKGFVKRFEIDIPIPRNEDQKQYISNLKASIKPNRVYSDGVNTIAQYTFNDISSQRINIAFEGTAKVRTYNIKNAKAINRNLTPEKDLKRYLKPEPLIESNDSYIKSIANKIKGNTQEEILQNMYEYIQNHMKYTIMNNIGAKKALQQGRGKCSEYAAIMVALCRAKNIPARLVLGNIAREKYTQHNWVEVYYDKYGWVMYDPTVQPVNVNVSKNGKLVRVEKRYDTSVLINYITAGRNKLSTYTTSYSVSDTRSGSALVTENIQISEIK